MKFLLNKALLARTYLLLHKVLFTNLLWCSRFSSCFGFSRLISIYHYISQVSRQYNISQKSFGALWLIWKICFKFQKLGMRERFCSLFKCYSLYCFGLLYKNRKKQIAVLQKNDLPITIHFSPPNVYSKNLIFCTFRALCWDVRRPMIHFSCTIFREKSLEFRIYVSLTNKISTSSIFYISCSRNFTSLSLFWRCLYDIWWLFFL